MPLRASSDPNPVPTSPQPTRVEVTASGTHGTPTAVLDPAAPNGTTIVQADDSPLKWEVEIPPNVQPGTEIEVWVADDNGMVVVTITVDSGQQQP